MKRLTPQALKFLRTNSKCSGDVGDFLGITPVYLRDLISANKDERLTSPGVLEIIKNHLAGMQHMELIEEIQVAA